MSHAIEVQGIIKRFGNRVALDDVSFSIAPGEMVALIGASGSGKSTLLRHIPGFIAADAGRILVQGHVVQADARVSKNVRRVRSGIGFIFQQFNLVNRLPVITNVLIGLLTRTPWWRSVLMQFSIAQRQLALEALVSVGIEQAAWQRASTLSGGQQQRAAIARCLVQGAKVILADEPIASLDPESSRKVLELLAALNRDHGCAVLVSLHQVELATRYCPRTIALDAGRVVYDGPSAALTPELLRELYGSQAVELFQSPPPASSDAPVPSLLRPVLAAV